jgi:dihydroflavonol-4-reductase
LIILNLLDLEIYNKDIDLAKVFITGATGFIGSHLADKLIAKNHQIKCLVRKNSNTRWLKDKPVEFVNGSLWDEKLLEKALADVDYVYHVGGITFGKKKEDYYKGNVEATANLIKVAHAVNPNLKKFIYVSSQTAVGPSYGEKPIDENTEYHPITTYGRSKMEGEKVVKQYFDKMKCTITRAPAVYGPRDYAILEYFKTMSRGLQPLIGFGNKKVSLIQSSDLVDGMILAGESEKAESNIYFITSERPYSWKEVGDLTSKFMGRKHITIKIPHFLVYIVGANAQFFSLFSSKPAILNLEKCRDLTQAYWTCSGEKAKDELGFTETLGLANGLKDTIDWYRKEGWIK